MLPPARSSSPLVSGALGGAVERAVSDHLGRRWAIRQARDMADYACHPAAILSDGAYAVFAKFSEAANGSEQFEVELAGLRLLSDRAGVLVPWPVGIVPVAGGSILVLEAVEAVERGPRQWRQMGRALARIHQIKGERFGYKADGFYGPLEQDNRPMEDWPAFYAERRLWPVLRLAIASGNLPREVIGRVERLISRVPELCGPGVVPALLHGDAQQNNFISTEHGAVVIDPAVYYGHPEFDLAAVDLYQAVPEDVYDGYREEGVIDPGFGDRRDLWRVCGYLAAVAVEGAGYLEMLAGALERYV